MSDRNNTGRCGTCPDCDALNEIDQLLPVINGAVKDFWRDDEENEDALLANIRHLAFHLSRLMGVRASIYLASRLAGEAEGYMDGDEDYSASISMCRVAQTALNQTGFNKVFHASQAPWGKEVAQ